MGPGGSFSFSANSIISYILHHSHGLLQILTAVSRYKELRAVLMEQQRHRERQQREKERQEQRRRDSQGVASGTGEGTGADEAAAAAAAAAMNACVTGLLLAQGTNHYETMAHQVGRTKGTGRGMMITSSSCDMGWGRL